MVNTARAEDNVTVNEQMMEVLSVAWKQFPPTMGEDWPRMKDQLLREIGKMEGMDDPADDYMVGMLAKFFQNYPNVLAMLNAICESVMGHRMAEFDEAAPPEMAPGDDEEEEAEASEPAGGEEASEAAPEPEPITVEPEPVADVEERFVIPEVEEAAEELALPETPVVPADADYILVPVYFATNRKRDKRYKLQRQFSGNRDNKLHYGLTHVSIPKSHEAGELETPKRWRFEKADPNRHILVLTLDLLNKETFIASANKTLEEAEQKEALVYIHGYNVSFGGAVRLTAQIAHDIGFKGIPITYSWPSFTRTLRYLGDEANIRHGQPFFDQFLETIIKELKVTKIHLLAHSMGNRLLTQGMQSIAKDVAEKKLGQVIFASPDVDKGVFEQRAGDFAGKAERYTLYINESDLALELSQFLHGFARAGERDEDPLVVEPVDTIDATNIDASFLGHNFYQRNETVLEDIMELVFNNLAPDMRDNLEKIRGAKTYWELK